MLAFRGHNLTLSKFLAINTYQLFCYDFLKFLAKGCFLLPLYLKNIRQQISNFSYLLLCARAIILKIGNFLLKGKVVGISWTKWPFSWSRGNGYYFVAFNWVLHFSQMVYSINNLVKIYLPTIAHFLACLWFNWNMA